MDLVNDPWNDTNAVWLLFLNSVTHVKHVPTVVTLSRDPLLWKAEHQYTPRIFCPFYFPLMIYIFHSLLPSEAAKTNLSAVTAAAGKKGRDILFSSMTMNFSVLLHRWITLAAAPCLTHSSVTFQQYVIALNYTLESLNPQQLVPYSC